MRVRFRLRTMVIIVAVVALAAAAARYSAYLRTRSREYTREARIQDIASRVNAYEVELTWDREKVRPLMELAQWHARRRDLYRRAASRPWVDVPDEPEPTSLATYLEAKTARARAAGYERGRQDAQDAALDALELSFKAEVSPEAYAQLQERLRATSKRGEMKGEGLHIAPQNEAEKARDARIRGALIGKDRRDAADEARR